MPHNELTELEAWLYFLASDKPADILRVVRKYPFFQEMYQDIMYFRYHPKELIAMYSEALRIMDKNTVDYMIERMVNEKLNEKLNEMRNKMRDELQNELRDELQNEFDTQLKLQQEEIRRLHALLAQYEGQNAPSQTVL